MIVGSLLLILVAVGLLVFGLAQGSSALLVGSIVASLLAAVALVVGARQAAAARAGARDEPFPGGHAPEDEDADGPVVQPAGPSRSTQPVGDTGEPSIGDQAEAYLNGRGFERSGSQPEAQRAGYPAAAGEQRGTATIPAQEAPAEEADPADEPEPQQVPAGDAARVARMSTEVLVVDGRPRYHVGGCVHLLGRAAEPLPVSEAVELGFTPCGLCEPDSALLADARRV
ncbi:hypothetical protein [Rhizomonospora bruguierae]|uniref:hypothetical protein n=1 Tax=Rhizomonospora bruguierae TaxID=1581705 RepID=UPI001BCEA8C1|nr:hypothetical protein [Micromonospora sp. NBRC 107566]